MGQIVVIKDFAAGDIKISTSSPTSVDLQTCIDVIEEEVLQELFGSELYELFLVGIVESPREERFADVFDKFYDDTDNSIAWCNRSYRSEGIKKMLMRFIFVKFSNDQPAIPTSTGHIKPDRNNAISATGKDYGIIEQYNKGVTSYQAIARLMILDDALYPEYNGIAKGKVTMI